PAISASHVGDSGWSWSASISFNSTAIGSSKSSVSGGIFKLPRTYCLWLAHRSRARCARVSVRRFTRSARVSANRRGARTANALPFRHQPLARPHTDLRDVRMDAHRVLAVRDLQLERHTSVAAMTRKDVSERFEGRPAAWRRDHAHVKAAREALGQRR